MKRKNMFIFFLLAVLLVTGCSPKNEKVESSGKKTIVVTTTMHTDMVKNIVGDSAEVIGLIAEGVDPHLFTPGAKDVEIMQNADIIVYAGLFLEGKMSEVLEGLAKQNKVVISAGDGVSVDDLIEWDDDASVHDPHVWFDTALWKKECEYVSEQLIQAIPEAKDQIQLNKEKYLLEIDEASKYVLDRANELPQEKRVLVTAHDAFSYFARSNGFSVKGLQGISTEAEAGTKDISNLADYIVELKLPAIFVESSIPTKTIEAVQAAVKAKGYDVKIGGELYSDSLGEKGSEADTYIGMIKTNIDTIVDALKE